MSLYMDRDFYAVSAHFMPALINADETGLETDDVQLLDNWLEKMKFPQNDIFDCGRSGTNFTTCSITGVKSNCEYLIVNTVNADITNVIDDFYEENPWLNWHAIAAYVEEHGVNYMHNFVDDYCSSFSFRSDVDDYLIESFYDCHKIPDLLTGYIDEKAIARDFLIGDYYILESGGEYHLFYNR